MLSYEHKFFETPFLDIYSCLFKATDLEISKFAMQTKINS